ncbi:MAG: flavin reductase family protein [Burkholderiales bacterium]
MNATVSHSSYLALELKDTTAQQRYKLFMGSVIPRPIALVSSLNEDGATNVAPFSNFMVVSSAEKVVVFSVGKEQARDRTEKDTLTNIRITREFVVNSVSLAMVRQVQQCAEFFPPEVSEATMSGLHLLPSVKVRTPRIAESKVQYECRLHSIQRFGDSHLVFGEVLLVHVLEEIFNDYKIDSKTYSPAGRIGGRVYCSLGDLIEV